MYEPLSWRVSKKSLSCKLALALGLTGVLLTGSFAALAQAPTDESLKPAIMSLKASSALLLDVAQAGKRLVAVGTRGHIVYSDNNGASWVQAPVPTRQLLTSVHFADARNGWAVGHDSLILHTSDAGESWTVQYRDPELENQDEEGFGYLEKPLMDVWFRDAQTGFAVGAYGLLLRTDNGGQDWDDVSFDVDNPDGFHYNAISEIKGSGLFMVGELGTMYRSADYGDTWETIEDMPYDGSWFGVSGTGEVGGVVTWGLRGNVFRSEDFGDSWEQVPLMTPNNGPLGSTLAGGGVGADGRLVIVGVGGVVAVSDDAGRSFDVTVRADRVALSNAAVLDNDNLLLVGQRGAVTAAADGTMLRGSSPVTVPELATQE